ncbi:LacI family DNA-binding transcriptional regulator [Flammeovirga agarivorans]|uniref:LacI family transcriptional regulator n=1 Tax=Flammeovirga agarivorans TaxID=2726742 RepID=A0A7X8XXY6_9BACT|nr:LacI family DNA-binding transcriptional regulator [Flammeovirga agarivorans]NLR93706.1 LacI family transcriptional regulator [Flammeovirga agarivorans]
MDKKVNLKSLSNDLNISVGTISRVLNGKAKEYRISEKTIKIVTEYAEKMGYQPNRVAQSLRVSKTFTVGLLVPDIANPFFSTMAKFIEKQASALDYSILLMDSDEDFEKEKKAIDQLKSRNVDGIILCPTSEDISYYEKVVDKSCPIVFIDRYLNTSKIPFITSDNYGGTFIATQYLINKGHRNITLLQGKQSEPIKMRVRGFLDALKKNKLSEAQENITGHSFDIEEASKTFIDLWERNPTFTAVIALSNTIGLGVLKAAKSLQLDIPGDISLIVFDEHEYSDFINPALTTVKQDKESMGKSAFEMLYKLIQEEDQPNNDFIMTTLVERKSVKKLFI